jgi:hypothetical protein
MPSQHGDFVILENAKLMHFRLSRKVVQAIPDFNSLPSEHFVLKCNYRVLCQKTCKKSGAAGTVTKAEVVGTMSSKKFEMIQAMSEEK